MFNIKNPEAKYFFDKFGFKMPKNAKKTPKGTGVILHKMGSYYSSDHLVRFVQFMNRLNYLILLDEPLDVNEWCHITVEYITCL